MIYKFKILKYLIIKLYLETSVMVDVFANELDELMGVNRNAPVNARLKQEHFSDGDVCKYFLVSVCPNDLFPNTKYDLGPCNKRHDEFFKNQFLNTTENERLKYEKKAIDEAISMFYSI